MNSIVSRFLLAGDKFMSEKHLMLDLRIVLADDLPKTKNTKI